MVKGFWKLVFAVICFFVPRLLNRLIFEHGREIKSSSLIVTVDRPGMGWDIVIYYLIAALIVFVASFYIDRVLSKIRTTMRYVIIVVISVAVVGTALFKSPLFLTPRVDDRADVSGYAHDPNQYYYLFVRPTGSGECWLQEPVPLMPGHDGKWRTTAYFGGAKGQKFEIIAIASRDELHPVTLNSPGSYNCSQIPRGVEHFVRIAEK